MISFFEASLSALSVHRVGNKSMDEGCSISDTPTKVTEDQASYLMQYFLSPFYKENDLFSFFHPNFLELNVVFSCVKAIFENPRAEHENSRNLARHLYDVSNHPKIKSGELYVALFKDVQFQGELFEAIGIFKSESKETYLKINPVRDGFDVEFTEGAISLTSVSKGCLILNTEAEGGYRILSLSEKSKDVSYWKDEFLGLKVVYDDYQQTNTVMGIFKQFVNDKLNEDFEISKADKIDLLNRSVKYFKEKECFDMAEFAGEVISNEEAGKLFKDFKKSYEDEFDVPFSDGFNISDAGVKKQSRALKGVLKLDKNFQINILGSKELVEKGFDEEKAMNFYKFYFKEEG